MTFIVSSVELAYIFGVSDFPPWKATECLHHLAQNCCNLTSFRKYAGRCCKLWVSFNVTPGLKMITGILAAWIASFWLIQTEKCVLTFSYFRYVWTLQFWEALIQFRLLSKDRGHIWTFTFVIFVGFLYCRGWHFRHLGNGTRLAPHSSFFVGYLTAE